MLYNKLIKQFLEKNHHQQLKKNSRKFFNVIRMSTKIITQI
jgi:hypothetical protein